MAKVRAVFSSREVLARGLTALNDLGVRDEHVSIREQRPRTGAPGYEYVDDNDVAESARLTDGVGETMAATGDNLVGNVGMNTTDSQLGDLLEAMATRARAPEREAGTRYEVIVDTDDTNAIMEALEGTGGRDVRIADANE